MLGPAHGADLRGREHRRRHHRRAPPSTACPRTPCRRRRGPRGWQRASAPGGRSRRPRQRSSRRRIVEYSLTATCPFQPSATPAASSPSPAVLGARPMANMIWSASMREPSSRLADEPIARLLDAGERAPRQDADAALGVGLGERIAQVLVEAAQDLLAAVDERHLRAEAGEDAGELHRDIAAAVDCDARGQPLEVESLIRSDDVLEPRDRVAERRLAARRDQDLARTETCAPTS